MARAVIVVPCFNEAERLDARRFLDYVSEDRATDFLLVNDGSQDRTLKVLEALHLASPTRFSFLHLAQNRGKAEAIRQGMLLALQSHPDYVGYWDADLATPLEEIPQFRLVLDVRPEIQLVMGSRLPLLGHRIERKPVRHYLGRLFANAASTVLGLPLYDSQCGAKLFRSTRELHATFARPFLSRWIIDVEILARLKSSCRAAGHQELAGRLYELPLQAWRDVAGSKLRPRDFLTAVVELAEIYWTYLLPGRAPFAEVRPEYGPTAPARSADSAASTAAAARNRKAA